MVAAGDRLRVFVGMHEESVLPRGVILNQCDGHTPLHSVQGDNDRDGERGSADGLFALPPDADPRQLAMLAINPPTAALLLSEYVNLKPGEWVVQNAANSGVGRWVIAFAKRRGLKTVNIVRRPELVPELEAIGGDVVVVESPDVSERIKAAVGHAEVRLALDGVSGPATGVLAATLSPGGTLVSFAAMSSNPTSISPLDVIFKPVTVQGFFMGHPEFAAKLAPAAAQAAEMIASGQVHIPVAATYALSSIKEAVAHAQRGGKVLLDVARKDGGSKP